MAFATYPEDKIDALLVKPGTVEVRLRPDAREIELKITTVR